MPNLCSAFGDDQFILKTYVDHVLGERKDLIIIADGNFLDAIGVDTDGRCHVVNGWLEYVRNVVIVLPLSSCYL
jgi:hypothetical protein